MANSKSDTVRIVESCGGKVVWPPTKLGKRHVKAGNWVTGQKLLVAILKVPFGDYFKEIASDIGLRDVKQSPYTATYMELSRTAVEALKAHPRRDEIFS